MDLLESISENFDLNFIMKEFPAEKTVHNLVTKLRTGLLLDETEKKNISAECLLRS
jgi:hypothetical protein